MIGVKADFYLAGLTFNFEIVESIMNDLGYKFVNWGNEHYYLERKSLLVSGKYPYLGGLLYDEFRVLEIILPKIKYKYVPYKLD